MAVATTNLAQLEHRELSSRRTGESFSRSAVLAGVFGIDGVFVHHDVLEPGSRASAPHYHTQRKEVVVVLGGEVTAWCNGTEFVLAAGDVIAFPPGAEHAHVLRNDSQQPARFLSIASEPAGDEVVYLR